MNEQEIRNNERNKVVALIRTVAVDIRKMGKDFDAKFLDELVLILTSPNWENDTKGWN